MKEALAVAKNLPGAPSVLGIDGLEGLHQLTFLDHVGPILGVRLALWVEEDGGKAVGRYATPQWNEPTRRHLLHVGVITIPPTCCPCLRSLNSSDIGTS